MALIGKCFVKMFNLDCRVVSHMLCDGLPRPGLHLRGREVNIL